MADYGSRANPVKQDPFQQIVDVHWPSAGFVAFQMTLIATDTIGLTGQACSPGVSPAAPGGAYVDNEIDHTSYAYNFEPGAGSSIHIWDKATLAWMDADADSFAGIPGAPSTSTYSDWERTQSFRPRWTTERSGSGDALPIPTYEVDGFKFATASSIDGNSVSGTFSGDIHCDLDLLVTVGRVNLSGSNIAPSDHAAFTLDLGGIVVVADGKAYRQFGVFTKNWVSQVTSPLTAAPRSVGGGEFWVLCKRSPSDDPTV